jgi:hypothetical protein
MQWQPRFHIYPKAQKIKRKSFMSGKTSGLFSAIAIFVDGSGNPLTQPGLTASVSDQDVLLDDCLGTAKVDHEGRATFMLAAADIMSLDSPGEREPDLYFKLFKDGDEIFRSKVSRNVDFESLDPVSGDPVQITQEFGPFTVTEL